MNDTRIMSPIDPLGRAIVTAGSDHYFHTNRSSVSTFLKSRKTKSFRVKIVIATSETVSLAEGTIDCT